jgi:hypothetical protein
MGAYAIRVSSNISDSCRAYCVNVDSPGLLIFSASEWILNRQVSENHEVANRKADEASLV